MVVTDLITLAQRALMAILKNKCIWYGKHGPQSFTFKKRVKKPVFPIRIQLTIETLPLISIRMQSLDQIHVRTIREPAVGHVLAPLLKRRTKMRPVWESRRSDLTLR